MTSKQSKRAARDELATGRRREAAAAQRRRKVTNVVIATAVVVVVLVIFVLVQNNRTSSNVTDAALPDLVAEQGGGMVFGDGPVTVDLWEDFQCPVCKDFEAANSELLTQQVDDAAITLVIHPLSFLDQNLSNTSSALAASAFGCSAAAGQPAAMGFHTLVYTNQPPENPGTEAWSTADLIGWGNDVGVSGTEWESCVTDSGYADWVDQVAKSQIDAGVHGTPTVFIDDQPFNIRGDLAAAISAATDAAS